MLRSSMMPVETKAALLRRTSICPWMDIAEAMMELFDDR